MLDGTILFSVMQKDRENDNFYRLGNLTRSQFILTPACDDCNLNYGSVKDIRQRIIG